jgi:hypothetical protein
MMRKLFRRRYRGENQQKSSKLTKMSSSFEDQDYHKDTTDFSDDLSESDGSCLDEEEFPKISNHFAGMNNSDGKLSKQSSKNYSMKAVIDESKTESSVCLEKEMLVQKEHTKQIIVINDEEEIVMSHKNRSGFKESRIKLEPNYIAIQSNPDIIFSIEIDKSEPEKELNNKKTSHKIDQNGFLSKDIFDD